MSVPSTKESRSQSPIPAVSLYGFSRDQLNLSMVATVVVVIPFAILLALFPFWESVGRFPWVRFANSYLAPSIDAMSESYRSPGSPDFPIKRVLIGCMSLIWVAFLSNFAILLSRSYREHALRVWAYYNRTKLLRNFLVSGVAFCALWYFFFVNWALLAFLSSYEAERFIMMAAAAFAVITFHFGHVTATIVLGSLSMLARWLVPGTGRP
jgi:hypothetical protein